MGRLAFQTTLLFLVSMAMTSLVARAGSPETADWGRCWMDLAPFCKADTQALTPGEGSTRPNGEQGWQIEAREKLSEVAVIPDSSGFLLVMSRQQGAMKHIKSVSGCAPDDSREAKVAWVRVKGMDPSNDVYLAISRAGKEKPQVRFYPTAEAVEKQLSKMEPRCQSPVRKAAVLADPVFAASDKKLEKESKKSAASDSNVARWNYVELDWTSVVPARKAIQQEIEKCVKQMIFRWNDRLGAWQASQKTYNANKDTDWITHAVPFDDKQDTVESYRAKLIRYQNGDLQQMGNSMERIWRSQVLDSILMPQRQYSDYLGYLADQPLRLAERYREATQQEACSQMNVSEVNAALKRARDVFQTAVSPAPGVIGSSPRLTDKSLLAK